MTVAGGPALVWCPFPDVASAETAASALLDERLIACANIVPGLRSLYVWNGERSESSETGALLKTDSALMDRVIARLETLHPYAEPAILGWRCDSAAAHTAAWLGALVA